MSNKLFLTIILCLIINSAKAQILVGVGCTIPPCSSCIAGYTGGTWSSSNTLRATVSSTGHITGGAAGTAVISYVFTAPACGSGTFTSTVSVVPALISATVSQTAPFSLSGDEAYTYCASTGFTLKVNTIPAALPGASYSWDDGSGPIVLSTNTYSPTYTSGSTAVTHAYTVTVSRGGCTTTATVNVVVPPSGCSPCDHYIVNTFKTTPIPSGTCSDCGTLQPFHTIISSGLTSTNTTNNANYYVVNNATFLKPAFVKDIFFMNGSATTGGVTLTVNTTHPAVLDDCHFFAAQACPWNGIDVTVTSAAAGQLTLTNTLIEDVIDLAGLHRDGVNVVATGSYYSAAMPAIINSQGSIFNNNYGGIQVNNYQPAVSSVTTLPFNFVANVFTNRDLANGGPIGVTAATNYPFSWGLAASMAVITTASSQDPTFGADVYAPLTYTTSMGHHGIQLNTVGTYNPLTSGTSIMHATYSYNYTEVGSSALDPSFANTNVFDNMRFGIQLYHSNAIFYNNTFRRVAQGIAMYNTINDTRIIGSSSSTDNTNNRFYANTQAAVHAELSTPHDFTCSDALFTSTNITNEAILLVLPAPAEHGLYIIDNNFIYNYVKGVDIDYVATTASTTVASGLTHITGNSIIGKTAAGSSTENGFMAIDYTDPRTYAGSVATGNVSIVGNNVSGFANGIYFQSRCTDGTIYNNTIGLKDHNMGSQYGIFAELSPYLSQITDNIVDAFGWDCAPGAISTVSTTNRTRGIYLKAIGSTGFTVAVSCNAVRDVNTGFRFEQTSDLQWRDNQMMRNQTGMELANSAVIGTQGSVCNPADNQWDNGLCGFCVTGTCSDWPTASWGATGVYETYVESGVTVGLSQMYVRAGAPFTPANNGAATSTTPYTSTDLLDATTLCTTGLGPDLTCSAGFRAAPPSGYTKDISSIDIYTLHPNPTDGNLVITRHIKTDAPVKVAVFNVLGQQVYEGAPVFENDKANITVKNVAPGMYQVKLTTGKGEVWAKKVIIQK